MKTLLDLLNGHTCGQDRMIALTMSNIDTSTPAKRFKVYMQLEWLYWSNQSSNFNYRNMTYEQFLNSDESVSTETSDSYAAQWIRTGSFPGMEEKIKVEQMMMKH